jgi:hypothetical protein
MCLAQKQIMLITTDRSTIRSIKCQSLITVFFISLAKHGLPIVGGVHRQQNNLQRAVATHSSYHLAARLRRLPLRMKFLLIRIFE